MTLAFVLVIFVAVVALIAAIVVVIGIDLHQQGRRRKLEEAKRASNVRHLKRRPTP